LSLLMEPSLDELLQNAFSPLQIKALKRLVEEARRLPLNAEHDPIVVDESPRRPPPIPRPREESHVMDVANPRGFPPPMK